MEQSQYAYQYTGPSPPGAQGYGSSSQTTPPSVSSQSSNSSNTPHHGMAPPTQDFNSGYYYKPPQPGIPPPQGYMVPGSFPVGVQPPAMAAPPQQHAPASAHAQAAEGPDKKRSFSTSGPQSTTRAAASYPRKRALTACDTCRLKKVKCDNVRPRCGSCVKNGITTCHYRTDDHQKDYSSYDPASLTILTKLDLLLKEVEQLKGESVSTSAPSSKFHFDRCFWDMSITSVLRWPGVNSALGLSQGYADGQANQLVNFYQRGRPAKKLGFETKLMCMRSLESIISDKFSTMINAFFINCHTKLPILDIAQVMESIGIYTMLNSYDKSVSFGMLLDCYDVENDDEDFGSDIPVPDLFLEALAANNLPDEPWRRRSFTTMCKSIPLLMIMCAIGVISTPVSLGNLDKFESSFDEADSLAHGALNEQDFENYPREIPRSRLKLSMFMAEYAKMVCMCYPFPKTLRYTEYLLLHGVYSLYTLTPLKAYSYITDACHNIMYYLQTKKVKFDAINDPSIYSIPSSTKERVERLFWSCVKIECELRIELSPYMPVSGITQVTPPAPFLSIPPPIEERRQQFSPASLQLAAKYDDEFTWYYFLTDIAVRKVDNRMFDELYSFEQTQLDHLWDQPAFFGEEFWIQFIKYSDQYNGIINSLSPQIRHFVLYELDVDSIYKRVKQKHDARKGNSPVNDVVDSLEDYLVDDDILLRAQSEQVLYMKTRIVTSKLYLIRPIVHFIVNNNIPLNELFQAAMSAVQPKQTATADLSPESTITNAASDMWIHDADFSNPVKTPHFYQKHHPDEDFSDVAEYDPEDNQSLHGLHLRDVSGARTKILKVFFQNVISLPKMHIPKLQAHRHMGSWFLLRNQFILTINLVLLYLKFQEIARDSENGEAASSLFDEIVSRESLVMSLEHQIIVFGYWVAECPDCSVYSDYAHRLLSALR